MTTVMKRFTAIASCPNCIYSHISQHFSFSPHTTSNSYSTTNQEPGTKTLFYTYDTDGIIAACANITTGTINTELVESQGKAENRTSFDTPCSAEQDTSITAHITLKTNPDILYYGYRFYSPDLGRWLSRDPIGEEMFFRQQLLFLPLVAAIRLATEREEPLYLFVRNNSTKYVDRLGLASFEGWSSDPSKAYRFEVGECEIAIIYGHGSPTRPHEIDFPENGCARAYYWGCYPDTTNRDIPDDKRLCEDIGDHIMRSDHETFKKLKELHKKAKEQASDMCDCCKEEGVWIRYVFSPSDERTTRILDWLKGNHNRCKEAELVGGDKWEGDTHIPCN